MARVLTRLEDEWSSPILTSPRSGVERAKTILSEMNWVDRIGPLGPGHCQGAV